jgi:multidrug/hemolysin transport system permease protein
MPLASFSEGLRNAIMFLPGTYGTSLIKNHTLNGVLEAMSKDGVPQQAIEGLKDAIDCNIYFFENKVPIGVSFAVTVLTVVALIAIYVLINVFSKNKSK